VIYKILNIKKLQLSIVCGSQMMGGYFLYKNREKVQQKANIFNKTSVLQAKKI
jgi:hypothetical protein